MWDVWRDLCSVLVCFVLLEKEGESGLPQAWYNQKEGADSSTAHFTHLTSDFDLLLTHLCHTSTRVFAIYLLRNTSQVPQGGMILSLLRSKREGSIDLWSLIKPFVPRPNPFREGELGKGLCQPHPQSQGTRKWLQWSGESVLLLFALILALQEAHLNSASISLPCTGTISKTHNYRKEKVKRKRFLECRCLWKMFKIPYSLWRNQSPFNDFYIAKCCKNYHGLQTW